MKQGLIHLYHGDGKGKTTAAVGLALRMLGRGERVLFVQFMKDGKSGEIQMLESLANVKTMHGEAAAGFYSQMSEEKKALFAHKQEELLENVLEELAKAHYGLLVLDEITYAYGWKLIDQNKLEQLLLNKPKDLEIVMTGRNPEILLKELSDYVTEMQMEKHPYQKGIAARPGVEF